MELPIPKPIKATFNRWELRVCILISLFLQVFLIVFSPLRKRCSGFWIKISIWSAYLLADCVAAFTVGLIATMQDNIPCNDNNNSDLLAFWAPFLLVHLGGPDSTTAYAMEDNELWRRHLASLIYQSLSAVYVFFQSLPKNQLWVPTLFMFISGIIKYGERIRSLQLASLDKFRETIITSYDKIMETHHSMKQANLPTSIVMFPETTETKSMYRANKGRLNNREVVLHAHRFFETFKGLIVSATFTYRERIPSRNFFLKRTAEDAFKVVESELNFICDMLFSKVMVVCTACGYAHRLLSSSLAVVSLYLFYFENKSSFKSADVAVTYSLLLGAIALDVIAFIKHITSDWLIVFIYKLPVMDLIGQESTQKSDPAGGLKKQCFGYLGKLVQVMQRRWSESVSGYNLIYYCQHSPIEVVEKIKNFLQLTFLDELVHVKKKPFTNDTRKHIFEVLKQKSDNAESLETGRELSGTRGEWAIQVEGCYKLLPYALHVDYDHSLLLWHIATELCYCHDSDGEDNFHNNKEYKDFSKLLSDYMIYLLIMQPAMMSTVAGIGKIRFRDTCAEAKKLFSEESESERKKKHNHIQRCKKILDRDRKAVDFARKRAGRSKSVLFDGCALAKDLLELKQKKWSVMRKVWVELLPYAAINCDARTHARQMSRGGELLTVVWMLMISWGLGNQFRIERRATAKCVVGK